MRWFDWGVSPRRTAKRQNLSAARVLRYSIVETRDLPSFPLLVSPAQPAHTYFHSPPPEQESEQESEQELGTQVAICMHDANRGQIGQVGICRALMKFPHLLLIESTFSPNFPPLCTHVAKLQSFQSFQA